MLHEKCQNPLFRVINVHAEGQGCLVPVPVPVFWPKWLVPVPVKELVPVTVPVPVKVGTGTGTGLFE